MLHDIDAGRGADEQHVGGADREESNSHHHGDLVELLLEGGWVGDRQVVNVEDVIAIVGDASLPPDRSSSEGDELTCDERARHGNDFDREWELAEPIDDLAVVHDANELRRSGRYDLLASQCGAPTLDELTGTRRLVGAIDIEPESVDLVQIEYLDTDPLQAFSRCVGARDRPADAFTVAREGFDEEVHRRASAHADDRAVLEAATEEMIDSRTRCPLLLCVTLRG